MQVYNTDYSFSKNIGEYYNFHTPGCNQVNSFEPIGLMLEQ